MHPVPVAQPAVRENVALEVTIIARVGVDQASDRPVFGSHLGLDAAPGLAIAGDHDCAFHRDAQPFQLLVIIRNAVVDINQWRSDISICGIRVISGKLLGLLVGSWIDCERRLLQRSREPGGLYQLDRTLFGSREEDVEVLDVRVQSPCFHFGQQPLGIVLVIGRANVMRPSGEPLHVLALAVRIGNGAELRLPFTFGACGVGRVARQCLISADAGGKREAEQKHSQKRQLTTSH